MATNLRDDILRLSIKERLSLVEDIWDSIASDSGSIELTEAQSSELDRRIEAYERDQSPGEPWDEVKEQIQLTKRLSSF